VSAFVSRVERQLRVQPRDAQFVVSLTDPRLEPGRPGVAVRARLLATMIRLRLRHPDSVRSLQVPTRVLPPRVTTQELTKRYSTFISISRGERRLRFFQHLRLVKTYVIAVGRVGLETPAGLYDIFDKQIDPSWHVPNSPWAGELAGRVIPPGPDDPLKARWLGFFDGSGIHGTDDLASLGTAASHGCIRMSIPDVIELYDRVPLHTPIYIF
jgi:lipoprotein-anchoring transpeptidase ErfK/SrfK